MRRQILIAIAFVAVLIPLTAAPAAQALPSPLLMPWAAGQTWYVCQGYNGQISHRGVADLDLTIKNGDWGPTGCWGDPQASAGKSVYAPGTGTAYLINGFRGPDLICITFDAGGSMAIGHLSNRVSGRVSAGQLIGTVEPGGWNNGGYAHIHLQAHSGGGCGRQTHLAFTAANGAQLQGAPDLPYSGAANQYRGLALTRPGTPPPNNGPAYVRYYTTATANLRSGPGTNYSIVQTVGKGTPVDVVCQSRGTVVAGSSIWNKLTGGQWISDVLTTSPNFNTLSPPNRWC